MKTNRSILAAASLLATTIPAAFGLTVPVQEDSFSANGNLSTKNGKATTLTASTTQTVFVKFNFNDAATVPFNIFAGNIVSANLRVYLGKAKTPGNLSVHAVTAAWSEDIGGPAPSFNPVPIATLAAGAQTTKDYAVFDITSDVGNFNANGYAIVSDAGKLSIPSKEGALPASELNIEVNYANDGGGTFNITNISATGNISAGGAIAATGAVSGSSLNTDGTNGSFFVNSGFDPQGGTTTLMGAFSGKNNLGAQLRFARDGDPDFTDIGQDGNDNFVIENSLDVAQFTLSQTGSARIGDTTGRLNVNNGGFSNVTMNLRAVAGDVALLNYQDSGGNFIGNVASNGSARFGNTGAQLNVNAAGFTNSTAVIQGRNATDIGLIVQDSAGAAHMKVGAFGIECSVGTGFKPGGGAWAVLSDARLKHNVEPLSGALDSLLRLRSVTFEYNDPAASQQPAGSQTGFIAQEVETVFPTWVGQKADGYKFIDIKGFESLTVQALRELRTEKDTQIEKLRAENAALKAQLGGLAERLTRLEDASPARAVRASLK